MRGTHQPWSCLYWKRPKNTDNGTGRIGNVSMIKEGDKFKDGKSGKVFTVTKIHSDRIMLEAEDGSFQSVIIPDPMSAPGRNGKRKRKPPIEANSN